MPPRASKRSLKRNTSGASDANAMAPPKKIVKTICGLCYEPKASRRAPSRFNVPARFYSSTSASMYHFCSQLFKSWVQFLLQFFGSCVPCLRRLFTHHTFHAQLPLRRSILRSASFAPGTSPSGAFSGRLLAMSVGATLRKNLFSHCILMVCLLSAISRSVMLPCATSCATGSSDCKAFGEMITRPPSHLKLVNAVGSKYTCRFTFSEGTLATLAASISIGRIHACFISVCS